MKWSGSAVWAGAASVVGHGALLLLVASVVLGRRMERAPIPPPLGQLVVADLVNDPLPAREELLPVPPSIQEPQLLAKAECDAVEERPWEQQPAMHSLVFKKWDSTPKAEVTEPQPQWAKRQPIAVTPTHTPAVTPAHTPIAPPEAVDRSAEEDTLVLPRPLAGKCEPPQYPRRARRLGLEGAVEVLVLVGLEGQVLEARVTRSSGHDLLDRAALEAALRWRFAPATQDGKSVIHDLVLPFRFQIQSWEAKGTNPTGRS